MASGSLPPWLAQAAGQGNSSAPTKGAIARRMKKKKGKGKPPPPPNKNSDNDEDDPIAG